MKIVRIVAALCCWCVWSLSVRAGLPVENFVVGEAGNGNFPLVTPQEVAALCYARNEHAGVVRAIRDLQEDVLRVTGRSPRVTLEKGAALPVIIGTLGRNALVTDMVERGILRAEDLDGKWESFVIAVVDNPAAGILPRLAAAAQSGSAIHQWITGEIPWKNQPSGGGH